MTDLAKLREPFDRSQIKQREGAGKRMLDYIQSADVIARVIDSTDNSYDWTVTRLEMVSDGKGTFWLCHGVLTIPGLGTRSGIGSAVGMNEDSVKSAETDAYKRAAGKFGVGLDLYFKGGAPQAQGRPQPDRNGGEYRQEQAPRTAGPPAVNSSNAACSECNAPAGKPHGSKCSVGAAK